MPGCRPVEQDPLSTAGMKQYEKCTKVETTVNKGKGMSFINSGWQLSLKGNQKEEDDCHLLNYTCVFYVCVCRDAVVHNFKEY